MTYTNNLLNNWETCKSYATLELLEWALKQRGAVPGELIVVVIPIGKNAGRFTAIFPTRGGENVHWAWNGFKVLG